eukprot:m.123920 g.123920  ORF g.123920 m.123920 type:complete len:238 (-) comp29025_c0_seq1:350-1063(-)
MALPHNFVGDGKYIEDGGLALQHLWDAYSLYLKPIRNCNGRYTVHHRAKTQTMSPLTLVLQTLWLQRAELKGPNVSTRQTEPNSLAPQPQQPTREQLGFALRQTLPGSRVVSTIISPVSGKDDVEVVRLVGGGGLLSYCKPDGTYVHTFNTESGLCRKIIAIGGNIAVQKVAQDLGERSSILFRICCRILSFIDDRHGERTMLASSCVVVVRRNLARVTIARNDPLGNLNTLKFKPS